MEVPAQMYTNNCCGSNRQRIGVRFEQRLVEKLQPLTVERRHVPEACSGAHLAAVEMARAVPERIHFFSDMAIFCIGLVTSIIGFNSFSLCAGHRVNFVGPIFETHCILPVRKTLGPASVDKIKHTQDTDIADGLTNLMPCEEIKSFMSRKPGALGAATGFSVQMGAVVLFSCLSRELRFLFTE